MAYYAAPAGQSSVVAGSYQATWDGMDLGRVSTDGYSLRYRNSSIPITSDMTGESIIDGIYSGTQPTITMTLQDWNAQGLEALTWWMGTQGGLENYYWGRTDGVGLKEFDAAKPLILTACHSNGSSASDANPTIDPLSITFFKTLLASDLDLDILFSHRPRFVTVTCNIMPVSVTGTGPERVVTRVNNCGSIWFWDAIRNEGDHLVVGGGSGNGGGGGEGGGGGGD